MGQQGKEALPRQTLLMSEDCCEAEVCFVCPAAAALSLGGSLQEEAASFTLLDTAGPQQPGRAMPTATVSAS